MSIKKINIITSFPKSGNTWVRFIIYDLLFNQHQINIDNSLEIEKKIPDLHNLKISNKKIILDKSLESKQVFLKTHFGFEKLKMMPIDKVIIVIRHPFDVLISLLNFYDINENHREGMLNYFCSNYTLPFLQRFQFPSWDQHIESWINSGKNYHIVKYSNLIDNFENEIKNLCIFLNLKISDNKIKFIKNNTKLENLKKIEIKERENNLEGFFNLNMKGKKTNFIYKGGYGNYKEFFNYFEQSKLQNSFKEKLEKYRLYL
jgi:hypothetical protein